MTGMSFLAPVEDGEVLDIPLAGGPAQGRTDLDFSEAFHAAYEDQTRGWAVFGLERAFRDAEAEQISQIREATGEHFPPLGTSETLVPGLTNTAFDSFGDYFEAAKHFEGEVSLAMADRIKEREARLDKLRDRLPGLKSYREMWQGVRQSAQDAEAKWARTNNRASGVVGGFIGATTVSAFVEPLGREVLLWICAALMLLIAVVAVWIDRNERDEDADVACCPEESEAAGRRASAVWEGARVVFKSRYLLAIAVLVGVYELVSNVADFQLATFVEMQIAGSTEKDAFFGFIGQITGIVSILVQLFVTTFVLRRFGAGVALFFLPVAFLIGSAGFLVIPTLFLVAFLRVSDNGLNYSINQSAREALYTPTSQDAKYKAKAFIDMFIQRAAKVVAVGLNLGLTVLVATQVRWLSLISIPLIVVWILLARYLKREFSRKKQERADIAAESIPETA